MNILSTNGASFYKNLQSEYISILEKLSQFYYSCQNRIDTKLILNNFTPECAEIPNAQLNLEAIYVEVKDVKTCKMLIDLTLQLLSESLPLNSVKIDQNRVEYEKLFKQVLYNLEFFSVDLKLMSLKFFTNIISNYSHTGIDSFQNIFQDIFGQFLHCVEVMVQSVDMLYEKGEVNAIDLDNYDKMLSGFIITIKSEFKREHEEMLLNICTVILSSQTVKLFSRDIKLQCLRLSNKINLPENVLMIEHMGAEEIEMVTEYYHQKIMEQIQYLLDFETIWCYKQTISVIKSINFCQDQIINKFLIKRHLHRSYSAFRILSNVFIEGTKISMNNGCCNKFSQVLDSKNAICILNTLLKVIEFHKNVLLEDINCAKTVLDILLSTVLLYENVTREEVNMIFQIVCFQYTPNLMENDVIFNKQTKMLMLKYAMVIKHLLKGKLSSSSNTAFNVLFESLVKNKTELIKEVSIIFYTGYLY